MNVFSHQIPLVELKAIIHMYKINVTYIFSSTGSIDPVASAKILKENGKISSDVILIFDKIYIQRC